MIFEGLFKIVSNACVAFCFTLSRDPLRKIKKGKHSFGHIISNVLSTPAFFTEILWKEVATMFVFVFHSSCITFCKPSFQLIRAHFFPDLGIESGCLGPYLQTLESQNRSKIPLQTLGIRPEALNEARDSQGIPPGRPASTME